MSAAVREKRLHSRRWLRPLLGSLGLAALFVPLVSAAGGASAQVARGEHVARLVCSACHVVAHDQEYPPLLTHPAPSFFDIAGRPGVSAQSLQHFITTTHWDTDKLPMSMPNPMLTRSDAAAVSQYILSLRAH
jgi:mono/diheme cytochrome c family protein